MILKSLFGSSEALAIRNGSWPLSQIPGVFYGGQESSAGVRVTEQESLSLSGVFAAINLLSAVIGALPLSVYQRAGRSRNVAEGDPAQPVLHTEFNPEMTAVIGRRTLEFHRLLWGNAYGEIGWDGAGRVAAVWPLEPWRVKDKRDEQKQLYYLVDGTRRVAAKDMIHVPLLSLDGVRGRSFVDFAIESLGLGLATQEFAARYFGNDASPGGILTAPGTPDKTARDEMKENWERRHKRKTGRLAVLWGGWKYEANDGSFNAQQSQLLEQRRFTIEEVARWFNIPPHMLRELSRSTNNNIEQQSIDLVLYTFGPVLVMYEQEYDRKLLAPPNLYSKHNVAALLRGDSTARKEFYSGLFNIGVLSINDILETEDRNPIEGGDTHFVPVNMRTLEQAIASPPPAGPVPAIDAPKKPGKPAPQLPSKNPEPTDDDYGPAMTPVRRVTLRLVGSTFERLLRVEATAAQRAAEKPGRFLAWMEEYYPRHESMLAEALDSVLFAAKQLGEETMGPDEAAKLWCDGSRQAWLAETGACKAAGLAGAVKQRLDIWASERAAAVALNILGGPDHGANDAG